MKPKRKPLPIAKDSPVRFKLKDGSTWFGTLVSVRYTEAQDTALIRDLAGGFIRIPINRIEALSDD